jgi:hypothetical protein
MGVIEQKQNFFHLFSVLPHILINFVGRYSSCFLFQAFLIFYMQNGWKNYVETCLFEKRKKIQETFKAQETASASCFLMNLHTT